MGVRAVVVKMSVRILALLVALLTSLVPVAGAAVPESEYGNSLNRVVVLGCDSCIGGIGHIALVLIKDGQATYFSFGPTFPSHLAPGHLEKYVIPGGVAMTPTDLLNYINRNYRGGEAKPYNRGVSIRSSEQKVEYAINSVLRDAKHWYSLGTNDCRSVVSTALSSANIPQGSYTDKPRILMQNIINQANWGNIKDAYVF